MAETRSPEPRREDRPMLPPGRSVNTPQAARDNAANVQTNDGGEKTKRIGQSESNEANDNYRPLTDVIAKLEASQNPKDREKATKMRGLVPMINTYRGIIQGHNPSLNLPDLNETDIFTVPALPGEACAEAVPGVGIVFDERYLLSDHPLATLRLLAGVHGLHESLHFGEGTTKMQVPDEALVEAVRKLAAPSGNYTKKYADQMNLLIDVAGKLPEGALQGVLKMYELYMKGEKDELGKLFYQGYLALRPKEKEAQATAAFNRVFERKLEAVMPEKNPADAVADTRAQAEKALTGKALTDARAVKQARAIDPKMLERLRASGGAANENNDGAWAA